MRRYWGLVTVGLALSLSFSAAKAAETVKIGAYYFPPFSEQTTTGVGGIVAGPST